MRSLLFAALSAGLAALAAHALDVNGSAVLGGSASATAQSAAPGIVAFGAARTDSVKAGRRKGPPSVAELKLAIGGKGLRIDYALPGGSARVECELTVHGMDGGRLALLTGGIKPPGRYRAEWAPAHRPRGVYFVRLKAGTEFRTRAVFLR